jgi:hypothetical protein
MDKDKSIAKRGETGIAVPDHLDKYKSDSRGTDHITKDDLKMPRLCIAQKMSPQLDEDSPKYIDGLKFGDLFNDLTNEIYGSGPVQFTILRADRPRAIEFVPMEEGGGIKDFDVPMNDPRTKWHGNEKPLATIFYDYVLALLPTREPIVLSLKTTGLKVAKQLNGLMKLRGLPCFTGLYEITARKEQNDKGSFGVYGVRNAGFVDEETAEWSESVFETLKDRAIDIDRGENDEVSVDAEVVDAEVVEGTQEKVPF